MNSANWLHFKLAFRNLTRNARRSAATGLAIMAGFCGLILVSAYIYRVQKGMEISAVYIEQKGHVAVLKKEAYRNFSAKPAKYILTAEDIKKIDQLAEKFDSRIEFRGSFLSGMGLISNGQRSMPFYAVGVEPEVYFKATHHEQIKLWCPDWMLPETYDNAYRFLEDPSMTSVTNALANLVNLPIERGKKITTPEVVQLAANSYFSELNAVNANVGAIHTTGLTLREDTSMITTLKTMQDLYATDGAQYRAFFLKDPSEAIEFEKYLQKAIATENLDLQAYSIYNEDWSPYFTGTMSFLWVMGAFFILLISAAVALSIINSTTLGILERTREIGTLRAIGFKSAKVQWLFILENLYLALFGVFAGGALALFIIHAVNSAGIRFEPPGVQEPIIFELAFNGKAAALLLASIIIVNITTTWFVTRSKGATKIVNLLSDEGV